MEKRREEKLSNERVVIPCNKLFSFLDKKNKPTILLRNKILAVKPIKLENIKFINIK